MFKRPALGCVSGTWRDCDDVRLLGQPHRVQPRGSLFSCFGPQKELRRSAIWRYAQLLGRREVALGDGPPVAIAVALPTNQPGSGEPVLRVGSPAAWHQNTECSASKVVVQIEQVSVLVCPQVRGQAEYRAARCQTEH